MGGLSLGKAIQDSCFVNNFPQITGIVTPTGGGGVQSLLADSTAGTGPPSRDPKLCSNRSQSLWNGAGSQAKFQVVYPLPHEFILSGTFKNNEHFQMYAPAQFDGLVNKLIEKGVQVTAKEPTVSPWATIL